MLLEEGIMDESALNYNADATIDEGNAPVDCDYELPSTVSMFDSYGDGWNGVN